MKELIVICGPTATGKTKLGLSLAREFNGEIISADSRQIYKGMDIGTGKDIEGGVWDKKSQAWIVENILIHMLDIKSPNQIYDVAQYKSRAEEAIEKIRLKGKLPIIVGGTGFYIKSLLDPIPSLGISQNLKLRKLLNKKNREELQDILKKLDANKFNSLNFSDQNNPRRLIRKIEIAKSRKKQKLLPQKTNTDRVVQIGLTAPLPYIYKLAEQRVDKMINHGLIKEIKNLLDKGYTWDDPGLKTLGYIEFKDFFAKQKSLEERIQKFKLHKHTLVRKQLTWFKKDKRIIWFDISQENPYNKAEVLIKKALAL